MFNLIYSDLYKMCKSIAVKVSLVITTMCAIIFVIASHSIAKGTLEAKSAGAIALLSDISMMSTIGAVIAGIFICSDFENKTVNAAISCGYRRRTLIISKAIVYFILMAIMLLPYSAITIIGFISGAKFGTLLVPSVFLDILSKNSGVAFSANVFFKMILIICIVTIVYAARLSLCVLLAFLLKKPALVVGAGFALAMGLDQVVLIKGSLGVVGKVLGYTPFAQGYSVLTMNAGAGTLLKAIACSLLFIIVILAITYGIFRKTEIK